MGTAEEWQWRKDYDPHQAANEAVQDIEYVLEHGDLPLDAAAVLVNARTILMDYANDRITTQAPIS